MLVIWTTPRLCKNCPKFSSRLARNGRHLGVFKISFQSILANRHVKTMYFLLILKFSPFNFCCCCCFFAWFQRVRELTDEPNLLKSDLKKPRLCPIWGQSDPLWSRTYHPWFRMFSCRIVRIWPKVGQIGSEWDKSGTF